MNSTPDSVPHRILVVDDAPSIHDDFRKILRRATAPTDALRAAHAGLFGDPTPAAPDYGFDIDCALQGREGLELLQRALAEKRPYALAFVDMRMPPGWDGIETIRHLWAADPTLQVVICTAYSDHSWEETVRQLGHGDSLLILKKPFDNIEVLQLAHALTKKWTVARRDRELLADLDERVRRRTAELHHSEERFAKMFHANPVPISLQHRDDGRYLDANPAFLQLLDQPRDAVIGRSPAELRLWPATDLWSETVRTLDAHTPLRSHRAQLCQRDGTLRDVLVSAEPADLGPERCILTTFEDITDRAHLEQQFRQAQKMEAVGQLAAGVAHDFNNLLTVVQAYTGFVLEEASLSEAHRTGLNHVRAAAERAAALTRQLLVFSRRQLAQPEPLDLTFTFASLREMLARLLPAEIEVEWQCETEIPRVNADEANIEQVIMNLVVNARDAMPRGGTLRLGLRAAQVTSTEAYRHPDARPGQFVCLSVSDDGSGIEPDVLARIFEPFFTTKGVGKGTGLGLSTVYAIVGQHEGWTEVRSTVGVGTTFEIYLPALDEPSRPRKKRRTSNPDLSALDGRGERILLVEDELAVRMVARAVIERAGYHVTEADDAPSALAVWDAAEQPFDLLLTDMVMPNGITGSELAAELRRRQPGLKIVLTTGYSHDLLKKGAQTVAGARILLKPFSRAPLLAILRETLDAPASVDDASTAPRPSDSVSP